MNIFFEIHSNIPRGGPGDNESTRRALSMMTGLPVEPRLLDIGCGPGMQTLELARSTRGSITGVDTNIPFLEDLQKQAEEQGLTKNIHPVEMSMFDLHFEPGSLDAIWSEGAIYIIGFERGLREWRQLLKPGGYVAVTELSWLKADPPTPVFDFWKSEYPQMKSVEENLRLIPAAGYREIGHFTLPESSWWNPYYNPLQGRINDLREKYHGDENAQRALDNTQREIDMYRKYSNEYGYEFYVMQAM